MRIDVLPDDVLLEIFGFYVNKYSHYATKAEVETWHSLVHVCRRWRRIVFSSPHRLNLQLVCTPGTPARDTLDVWPALPLFIRRPLIGTSSVGSVDDIVVALGHSNRICEVDLGAGQMEKVLAAMQVPFPELTRLRLWSSDKSLPVTPDSFLGGSAPHLRVIDLWSIPFPGLPKLLLSATQLIKLELSDIPHSGYFSPEAMVALLPVLFSLETLHLYFRSPESRPDLERRRPPPLKRSIIPSLKDLWFNGVNEYLEDLVACIDAPQLHLLDVIFFKQIDFDTRQLTQFINRTPKFCTPHDRAYMQFDVSIVQAKLTYRTHEPGHASSQTIIPYVSHPSSRTVISCGEPVRQVSSIAQAFNSSLLPLSMVVVLTIEHKYYPQLSNIDAVENTAWLGLLLPFTAVKNLYLGEHFAPGIAAALQDLVGARIAEVLPSLQNIFVDKLRPSGRFQDNIREFVAARRLSGHPVAISVWNRLD